MAIFELSMIVGAIVEMATEAAFKELTGREKILEILHRLDIKTIPDRGNYDAIYAYTLVLYGHSKPELVLNFFRNEFVKEAFRQSFLKQDISILDREAEGIIQWNRETKQLGEIDYDPRLEFAQFTAVFNEVVDSSRTLTEVKRDQLLDNRTLEILETLKKLDSIDDIRAEILSLSGILSRIEYATREKIRQSEKLIDQTPGLGGRSFIGRLSELEQVEELLNKAQLVNLPIAICGMAGIGKTMIAEEVVRRISSRYTGGVIIERRGKTPPSAQEVLQKWANYVFDIEPEKTITFDEARSLLSGYGNLLVVIDDIWPVDFTSPDSGELSSIRQLLSALPSGTSVILTTRFLDGAESLTSLIFKLEGMVEDETFILLKERLSNKGPEPSEDLLERLHIAVHGHPLALELAAGRVKDTTRLEKQVEKLENRIRIGDLSKVAMNIPGMSKDVSLLASLDESLEVLRNYDKQSGSKLTFHFAMLGVFAPEAPFDATAAGAIWSGPDAVWLYTEKPSLMEEAEEDLDMLVGYALLDTLEGNFTQHLVLNAFALGLLLDEGDVRYAETVRRHVAYYTKLLEEFKVSEWKRTAIYAENIIYAGNRCCQSLADGSSEAIIHSLAEPKPTEEYNPRHHEMAAAATLAFAISAKDYILSRRVESGLRFLRFGLAASRLMGAAEVESVLLNVLGNWYRQEGQLNRALEYFRSSAELHMDVGNHSELALVLNNIANVYLSIGELNDALWNFKLGLAICRELNLRNLAATITSNISIILIEQGKPKEALKFLNIGFSIKEKSGSRHGLDAMLINMSGIAWEGGYRDEALEYLYQGLSISRELGNRDMEATALLNIGEMIYDNGQDKEAKRNLEEALSIFEEIHDWLGVANTLNALALLYDRAKQHEQALLLFERGVDIAMRAGATKLIANLLYNLACLLHETPSLGRSSEAPVLLERSISLVEKLGLEQVHGKEKPLTLEKMRTVLATWTREAKLTPHAFQDIIIDLALFTDWNDLYYKVENHPELLSPLYEEKLNVIIKATKDNGASDIADILVFLKSFFIQCREVGHSEAIKQMNTIPSFQKFVDARKAIFQFIQAKNWIETRAYLEEHPQLNSPDFEAQFEVLAKMAQLIRYEELADTLTLHKDLLKLCRAVGIDEAFKEAQSWPTPQLMQALWDFVFASDWNVSRKVLDDHPELLSRHANRFLNSLVLEAEKRNDYNMVSRLRKSQQVLLLTPTHGFEKAVELGSRYPEYMLEMIAVMTIAAMTDRKDMLNNIIDSAIGLREAAEEIEDDEMKELLGTVIKLLKGSPLDILDPYLVEPYSICWSRIVEALGGNIIK